MVVSGDGDDRHRICGKLQMEKLVSPEYNIEVVLLVDKEKRVGKSKGVYEY